MKRLKKLKFFEKKNSEFEVRKINHVFLNL